MLWVMINGFYDVWKKNRIKIEENFYLAVSLMNNAKNEKQARTAEYNSTCFHSDIYEIHICKS